MAYSILHIRSTNPDARGWKVEMTFDTESDAVAALEAMAKAQGFKRGAFRHYGEVWTYDSPDSHGYKSAQAAPEFERL